MLPPHRIINPFFNPSLPVPERTHTGPVKNAYEFITVTEFFQKWLKQNKPSEMMAILSASCSFILVKEELYSWVGLSPKTSLTDRK